MTETSKEYGTALFMLACEKNKKEEYAEAIDELKNAFLENPDYIAFLSALSIPLSERLAAIEQAFSKYLPEDVVSYLKLLCEKGRISYFFDSIEEYKNLLDASKHVINAKITSAVALTEGEKNMLRQKLEAMSKSIVSMEYFIDKSLIGGVIVEMAGKVLDGSLRNRLHDIKEVING